MLYKIKLSYKYFLILMKINLISFFIFYNTMKILIYKISLK